MADRWTPPKADEHLKRPTRELARVVVEDKPMVWPQPCRWQAALNRRLMGIAFRAGSVGLFLDRDQLAAALREKARIAAEMRQMWGVGAAPIERLRELDPEYANRLCDAAGIDRRFASPLTGVRVEAGRPSGRRDPSPGGEEAGSPGGDGPPVPRDAAGLGVSQDDLWWSGLEELEPGRDDEP